MRFSRDALAAVWIFLRLPNGRLSKKTGADLLRLDSAVIRRSYEGLRTDFQKLAMASVLNELMLKTAPQGEPCPDLFRLHSNALAVLDETQEVIADFALLNGYIAKLLQWSGNQPQLQSCIGCGIAIEQVTPDTPLTCMVADAGWICASCRTSSTQHLQRNSQSLDQLHLRITPLAVRDFQSALEVPIRQMASSAGLVQASRMEHQSLFKFLEALVVYHLPGFDRKPLTALRFLDGAT